MTVVETHGTPLPMAERAPLISFEAENSFWTGLRASFGPVRHEPLRGSRLLLASLGVALHLPEETALLWARYEVRAGEAPCAAVFPSLVTEQAQPAGPARFEDGRLERDLVPVAGGEIGPAVSGWVDGGHNAVWDFHPRPPAAAWAAPYPLACFAAPPGTLQTRHRLVAHLAHRILGRRLALFTASVTGTEGDPMADRPASGRGLSSSAHVVASRERVEDLRGLLATGEHEFAVVVDGERVTALLNLDGAMALDPAGDLTALPLRPPPAFPVERPVLEIAQAARAELERDPRLLGVVLLDGGGPVGVLRTEILLALAGTPTRGVDRLGGDPLSRLAFVCPVHDERVEVAYYDPDDPPRCSHGDLMRRQRS
ncbi:hypothetical protein HNP84_004187 [Thermocatellispora tengchongensis]|uniref:Uncharacterized protein n=1 Tax=Thermocatellispora tengchongensis TaxID=1073253 RepID=A0A840PEJ1_9ACTN|nr:hypothetical protein [Thermocatellispora tengchongensis]MBB5134455.1 hypothetical protein [Thermocatellispora tengchongensis]